MTLTEAQTATARSAHATGPLLILAGVLFVAVPLLVELLSDDFLLLMPVALACLLGAMPGIRRLQAGRDGSAGTWGVRLSTAGIVGAVGVFVVGGVLDPETGSPVEVGLMGLVAVFMLAAVVGIVTFAKGLVSARVFPAHGQLLFVGGLSFALVSELLEQTIRGDVPWLADVAPPVGFISCGVGLLLLGRFARQATAR